MVSNIAPIPIVLLHFDQPDVLLRCVELIHERTNYPFRLFVVDNCSPQTDELIAVFSELKDRFRSIVIFNSKNNWVYGFNQAITHSNWPKSQFYAFSDADIYVPEEVGGVCWLTHLVNQMFLNCSIGKLGLSLNLNNLGANPNLKESLSLQKSYLLGPKIGENIVAPVDTTMALYRSDFFITSFKFQIGHASLAKPHYYTCRASNRYAAIHVGWDYYPNNGEFSYSLEKHWKKAILMANSGAYFAPELAVQFGIFRRSLLRSLQFSTRAIHALKIAALMLCYLMKRFPRGINEIQSKVR